MTTRISIIDENNGLLLALEETERGSVVVPVHTTHVHERDFITHLYNIIDSTFTTEKCITGDYILPVMSDIVLAGDKVRIFDNFKRERDVIRVSSVDTGIITLSRRLDYSFEAGATVQKVTVDMNVNASMESPVSFIYTPRVGKIHHVETINIYMSHTDQPYDNLFGGIAALTNDIQIRKYSGTSNTFDTVHAIRQNRRLWQNGFSVTYGESAHPTQGTWSTRAVIHWLSLYSAMKRLVHDDGDYIQVLITNDLSSLASFEMTVGGHEEL